MSATVAIAIGLVVLAVAGVNVVLAWRQLHGADYLLDDAEQQAVEHARPLGNVHPIRRPLEPD